jgi:hypothetical protein
MEPDKEKPSMITLSAGKGYLAIPGVISFTLAHRS